MIVYIKTKIGRVGIGEGTLKLDIEGLTILIIPSVHRARVVFGVGEGEARFRYDLRVASQMVEKRQSYLLEAN